MASPRLTDPAPPGLLIAKGHILGALATGHVVSGTLDDVTTKFAVSPAELRACLRHLVDAGWVCVCTGPGGASLSV